MPASISNTATATATPPPGDSTPVSPPSTATVTITPNPALTVVKSASPATVTAVGQSVTYSFLVTNTGNVTLTESGGHRDGVHRHRHGPDGQLSDGTLAPGGTTTCTATYVATQADIDAGTISNTATATAIRRRGRPRRVDAVHRGRHHHARAGLTVVKSASPTTVTAAGQTVTYSFLVTNTGNVTLTDRWSPRPRSPAPARRRRRRCPAVDAGSRCARSPAPRPTS